MQEFTTTLNIQHIQIVCKDGPNLSILNFVKNR